MDVAHIGHSTDASGTGCVRSRAPHRVSKRSPHMRRGRGPAIRLDGYALCYSGVLAAALARTEWPCGLSCGGACERSKPSPQVWGEPKPFTGPLARDSRETASTLTAQNNLGRGGREHHAWGAGLVGDDDYTSLLTSGHAARAVACSHEIWSGLILSIGKSEELSAHGPDVAANRRTHTSHDRYGVSRPSTRREERPHGTGLDSILARLHLPAARIYVIRAPC